VSGRKERKMLNMREKYYQRKNGQPVHPFIVIGRRGKWSTQPGAKRIETRTLSVTGGGETVQGVRRDGTY